MQAPSNPFPALLTNLKYVTSDIVCSHSSSVQGRIWPLHEAAPNMIGHERLHRRRVKECLQAADKKCTWGSRKGGLDLGGEDGQLIIPSHSNVGDRRKFLMPKAARRLGRS
jgi:hypothetical protein